MEAFDIQAFSYEQRHGLLSSLTAACCDCGGWILERKTLSQSNIALRIEIRLGAILDLYAAIVGIGVEPTLTGHKTLTELCTRKIHQRLATDLGQTVAIRLEINFLDDVTPHSLLSAGSPLA